MNIIIPELNNSTIRTTEDGRFSVFDLIKVSGEKKNPRDTWQRLVKSHPNCVAKTDAVYLGSGQGRKKTPVATLENSLYILGLLPGAMGNKYRENAANLVCRYLKGDADLGAELIIRDHNKDRQNKALKRVKATLSNKAINALSQKHGAPYHKAHDDRNLGLYGLTTRQVREVGCVGDETPLNYMSDLDLSYADAANGMVAAADDLTLMQKAAEGLAKLHHEITGQKLNPVFDTERLTPAKARLIVNSPTYQIELPV